MKKAIIYGGGTCFLTFHRYLKNRFDINQICDEKYRNDSELPQNDAYTGLSVVSKEEIKKMNEYVMLVCIYNYETYESICEEFEIDCDGKREVIYVPEMVNDFRKKLSLEEIIKKSSNYIYKDELENKVILPERIKRPANIDITFEGTESVVIIGNDIVVQDNLNIYCGSECRVKISDGCTFIQTNIFSAWENVVIGKDSMFSFGVNIQNHDGHLIFDKKTGDRINYAKSINIGEHVWVGINCTILHGAEIGNGSVVGANALVVGTKYPDECVIAGNPAKVIKDGIVWDRKWSCVYNCDNIDQKK